MKHETNGKLIDAIIIIIIPLSNVNSFKKDKYFAQGGMLKFLHGEVRKMCQPLNMSTERGRVIRTPNKGKKSSPINILTPEPNTLQEYPISEPPNGDQGDIQQAQQQQQD